MAQHENYNRCHAAVQCVLARTTPCLQNAIDLWHQQISQRLQSCTAPNVCPANKKPLAKNKSCSVCISWAQEIEKALYQPATGKARELQWSNVNPSLFGKDPLEVIKLFALRLPPDPISTLGDFDPASLLVIMANFKEFHNANQAVYDKVMKVSQIRNALAHLKLDKNLNLDDQTFNKYWTDIAGFVNAVQSIGRSYFTKDTAQDIHDQLTQIKIQKTVPDVSELKESGDPLDVTSCRKILKGMYRQKRSGIGFLPGFPKEFPSDEFFVELQLSQEQKAPTEVKHVPLKTYTDLLCIQDKQGKPLDHVLVTGLAGTGKTTLVSRLAYQWATECDQISHRKEQLSESDQDNVFFDALADLDLDSEECVYFDALQDLEDNTESLKVLKRFELVFALDIRKFEPEMNLVDAIKDQLLNHVSTQALHEYLLANADRCLFLCDGYDELSSREKVLSSNVLHTSNVILTSRPDKRDKINHNLPGYVHVSLNGFSEESVSKFVHKFFNESETDEVMTHSKGFLKLIHESETLKSLSQYPLLLAMMCLIFDDEKELPETISGLFDSVIEYLAQHWKARKYDSDDISVDQFKTNMKFNDILAKLGCTAFKGLRDQDSKLIFKADNFESQEVMQKGCDFGLLLQTSRIKGIKYVIEVSFIHKTFQEYCAAMYLSSLGQSDRDSFNDLIQQLDVNDEGMVNMLKFCCGSSEETAGLVLPCISSICKTQMKCVEQVRLGREMVLQILPIVLLYEVEMKFGFNQVLHDALKPIVTCFIVPIFLSIFPIGFINAYSYFMKCGYRNGWYSLVKELHLDNVYRQREKLIDCCVNLLPKLTCLTAVHVNAPPAGICFYWDELRIMLATLKEHPNSSEIDFFCHAPVRIDPLVYKDTSDDIYDILQIVNSHPNWHLRSLELLFFNFNCYVIMNQSNYLQIISELHDLTLMPFNDFELIHGLNLVIEAGEMLQQESLVDISQQEKNAHLEDTHNLSSPMLQDDKSRNKQGDRHLIQLPLQKLTIIRCTLNTFHYLKWTGVMKYLGSLRDLTLENSPSSEQSVEPVILESCIVKLTNLRKLHLSYIHIGNEMKPILHGISLNTLSTFHLNNTPMTEESKDALFGLQPSCDPDPNHNASVMPEVPSLKNMQHLTELIIRHIMLGPRHINALSKILQNMPHLTTLDLPDNEICSDGLPALCRSFQYTPNLARLDLSGNDIGSDGVVGLANSFKYISKIIQIHLSNNLSPEGIEAIFMNIHHVPCLQKFSLGALNKVEVKPGTTLDIIIKKYSIPSFGICELDDLYYFHFIQKSDIEHLRKTVQELNK